MAPPTERAISRLAGVLFAISLPIAVAGLVFDVVPPFVTAVATIACGISSFLYVVVSSYERGDVQTSLEFQNQVLHPAPRRLAAEVALGTLAMLVSAATARQAVFIAGTAGTFLLVVVVESAFALRALRSASSVKDSDQRGGE